MKIPVASQTGQAKDRHAISMPFLSLSDFNGLGWIPARILSAGRQLLPDCGVMSRSFLHTGDMYDVISQLTGKPGVSAARPRNRDWNRILSTGTSAANCRIGAVSSGRIFIDQQVEKKRAVAWRDRSFYILHPGGRGMAGEGFCPPPLLRFYAYYWNSLSRLFGSWLACDSMATPAWIRICLDTKLLISEAISRSSS